jgi:2,3-diketo-5-methylthio-1-phosphopentane phosphatase
LKEKVFKIFIDFDGTVTQQDTGDAIFSHFGETGEVNKIIDNLLNDVITAKQCWIELCNITGSINKQELNDFIDTIKIDPTFHEFTRYCRKNEMDFYVLSDGFDYYIDRIFLREGLKEVKYYANHLEISEVGELIPTFPYEDFNCSTTSANCKRNHIINNSSDSDFTVYIGDGNSDKYTSPFCDFIFAKDDLLKFCEKERITFFPYNNFLDVIMRLEQLRSRKRLKKRHQAELKRREIYMLE